MKKQIVLLAMALMAVSGIALAQDVYWNGGTGNWADNNWSSVVTNWDGYNAIIEDGAVSVLSKPPGRSSNVRIGRTSADASLTIGSDFDGGGIVLGDDGSGAYTLNITNGTVSLNSWNYFGYKGGSSVVFNLSGGIVQSTGKYNTFGKFTPVVFNQTGGTYIDSSTAGDLGFGTDVGGAATINLKGGTFAANAPLTFFSKAAGDGVVLNIDGGAFESSSPNVTFGWDAGSVATLNVTNGTLTHTASADGSHFIIGRSGTVVATVDDGGVVESSADWFTLGYYGDGTGTLNINAGGTVKHTPTETDALFLATRSGHATININGGALESSAQKFTLTYNDGGVSELNLNDGLLKFTGSWFYVARKGTGEFHQSGGVADLTSLIMADYSGSGLYSISGGEITASKYFFGHTAGAVFEVDGSGATKIETGAVLFPSGTLRFKLDENGSTLVKAVGGYYDRGIELTNATVEVETLVGFDGVAGSTYDLMWTTNGFLTSGMSFVDNSGIGFEWSIVAKAGGEVFQIRIPGGSPSEDWATGFGLTGADAAATADPDGDGLSNLYEYGLGGDPTNSANTGISPVYGMLEDGGTNWFEYIYPRQSDINSGLTYHLELIYDLIYKSWDDSGYTVTGTGTIDDDFDAVTNRVSTESENKQFIRLIIEE